ncbi:MAG: helix-turn-helix domain-containing protein, partial [Stackebrandtia sp.]
MFALTGGETEVAGRVAGAVLAAIRVQLGRTQEQLATELSVGLTTIQAWESGRRPLINGKYT